MTSDLTPEDLDKLEAHADTLTQFGTRYDLLEYDVDIMDAVEEARGALLTLPRVEALIAAARERDAIAEERDEAVALLRGVDDCIASKHDPTCDVLYEQYDCSCGTDRVMDANTAFLDRIDNESKVNP